MRIVFMGTPAFAVASLAAILEEGHEVAAVITATDKPGGRGRKALIACPVAVFARAQGLPVLQPEKLRDPSFLETLRHYRAELFVVVAFRMLPEVVWSMPPKGTVNLHGSLLPAYRGAAPIHWAVLNGERETGVTVFFLRKDIDTGDILHREHLPIGAEETTGALHDRMMLLGARALCRAIRRIEAKDFRLQAQPVEAPSHAPKLWPETAALHCLWPVERIHRWVRGMHPYPAAWISLEGRKMKILATRPGPFTVDREPGTLIAEKHLLWLQASDGLVEILELQPEGRQAMSARDYLNGIPHAQGIIGQAEHPDHPATSHS
jgi:methionyl-tRNA formyltransferase